MVVLGCVCGGSGSWDQSRTGGYEGYSGVSSSKHGRSAIRVSSMRARLDYAV